MLQASRQIFWLTLAILFVFRSHVALAAMTSTNYKINWDEFSSGGGTGASASYKLRDSASGSGAATRSSSAGYAIDQGFRAGVYDSVVDFVPYVEDRSTQVAATAFTTLPLVVTVTTASGFAVNDWIAIVQDEGASQATAMAQISNIAGSVLTLRSSYSGSTPVIDGSNDYVYRMSPTASISLGTLSTSSVTTHIIGWVSTADVPQGFSMYMFANGEFTDGVNTIPGVADGAVSVGVNEYGGRSSDSTLATSTFDTVDTAFTTEPVLVGSTSSTAFSSSGFVTLKTAIASSQVAGTYAQTLTTIFVGDY